MSTIPLQRQPPAGPPPFARIGIVGLGLIGGSIALAARQAWPGALVIAVDNKDVLETAMRLHAIDVAADDLIILAEVDLVVLAAPVRQNIALLSDLDDYVGQPAIVTDVGSTKRATMAAARQLPRRFGFIGGHPLAGAAAGGLEHARPELFRGRPWILTPPIDAGGVPLGTAGERDGAGSDALARLTQFVSGLGAEPRVMTDDAHDRLVACLSHLPQLAASALMRTVGEQIGADGLQLAGRGLIDTTRLASSPVDIWRDIAATNADYIRPALDALVEVLTRLKDDLDSGEELEAVFADAQRWRALLKP